jgi:cytochrome c oxidase subunit II
VPRSTYLRLLGLVLVLTLVMAIPMTQIHWDGTQASTAAPKIDTLLNVMIVLSSFVLAIVLVALGYCIYKYRAKPGDESDGEPIHGNTKLEIAWTVIPTIIVLFGAVYSAVVLADIERKDPNRMVVDVTAQQYKWTFSYPMPNGKVVNSDQLYVPVDRQIEFHLTALDVLHSFWVPEWRIKRDLVPAGPSGNDIDNTVVVTPDRLGDYEVVCTELCGFGHATMRAFVHVLPDQKFSSWLATEAKDQAAGGGPPAPTTTISTDTNTFSTVTGTTTAPASTSTSGTG